uniref:FRIGIDA-like protein n=1 Tax=Tanacetum cinerariifolium TaxID=118510 RepID=A0A6L2J5N9_TANCI|nr:protein FRIGIDA-like [Tanacetum cinerariifolium]
MDAITTTKPPFNLKSLNQPPPKPPPSIAELRHISAALSQFLRDYDDLQSHIGSVNAALDEKLSLRYKGNVNGTVSDEGVKNCEKSDCDGVVNDVLEGVVVRDGKCQGSVSESECERSDVYKSSNYVKKREESDCEHVVCDDCERGDGNVRMMYQSVKKDKEIIDALVKMEESDCAEIVIDVSEAVVSEQNLNGSEIIVTDFGDARVSGQSSNSAASECEQGDDDVRIDESPNSPDSCKETDNESEETDDEGEKLGAAKNVEETDYDRAINEPLEEIDAIQKNPIRTASKCDNVRKPQSSSSLENQNSEETDDEDGEIEAPKKPEDADYDRIVTELLEDIDVVPKPNRTASDSDQSYDKPQSPTSSKNHLDEIDVSINPEDQNQTDVSMETNVSEKHEEIDILKNPAESDVSEEPEEIDIVKNPEETDVFKKPEEADVSEKPEEADVSEKPEYVEILKNPKPAVSELEMLCKSMSGREMKKYVVKHISDIDKLRTELLKALKLAINPAKLVLDGIGTYFLQSGKTYNRGSYHYLNDGKQASVLILECFVMISGDVIKISREDEASAAKAANLWKHRMINEGGLKYTEEADARGLLLLISGFGISDRFFSTVDIMDLMMASNVKGISNILRRSVLMPKIPEVIDMMVMSKLEVQAADIAYAFGLEYKCHPLTILAKFIRNIIGDIKNGSPVQVIEAMNQKLDDLISVKECLESHNIDPSKVLSEFKIDEEIHHLKKELKLQVQKRKAMGILPNPNHQEAKRTCFSHQTMPHVSLYNQSMQPGYSYRDSNYIPPSLLKAPALPVNITNSVTSGLAGPNGNIWPYGWQDESSALVEKYLVQPYPRQSQTYDTQPSLTGFYGRRPGFPVFMPGRPGYIPSGGFPARRGPGSDLYAFADVAEKETRGSRAVGSGTGRPSYY